MNLYNIKKTLGKYPSSGFFYKSSFQVNITPLVEIRSSAAHRAVLGGVALAVVLPVLVRGTRFLARLTSGISRETAVLNFRRRVCDQHEKEGSASFRRLSFRPTKYSQQNLTKFVMLYVLDLGKAFY